MKEIKNYKNRENNDLRLIIENPMMFVVILIATVCLISVVVKSCEGEEKSERLKIEQDSIRRADSIKAEKNYNLLMSKMFQTYKKEK